MSPTVVVGAGIIGVATAYELRRRGEDVVLVDPNEPGSGASFGNMACIAVTEFMPASRPGIWAQMPKWLLDPEGPVRVRPGYMPRLIPWFLRFLAASRPSKLRELEAAGAALCGRVYDDLLPLLADAGASEYLTQEGCLSLYKDDAEFAADRDREARGGRRAGSFPGLLRGRIHVRFARGDHRRAGGGLVSGRHRGTRP